MTKATPKISIFRIKKTIEANFKLYCCFRKVSALSQSWKFQRWFRDIIALIQPFVSKFVPMMNKWPLIRTWNSNKYLCDANPSTLFCTTLICEVNSSAWKRFRWNAIDKFFSVFLIVISPTDTFKYKLTVLAQSSVFWGYSPTCTSKYCLILQKKLKELSFNDLTYSLFTSDKEQFLLSFSKRMKKFLLSV